MMVTERARSSWILLSSENDWWMVQLVLTFIVPPTEMQKPSIAYKVVKHWATSAWDSLGSAPRILLATVAAMVAAALPLLIKFW